MSGTPARLAPSNFSGLLGIEQVRLTADRAEFRMPVATQLANRNGVLHGGALMSLIDHAAGTLALVNCPDEMTNVTVESKTNFFRAARIGDCVTAVSRPLHTGSKMLVFQVTTSRGDGKELSATLQTHLLLEWTP